MQNKCKNLINKIINFPYLNIIADYPDLYIYIYNFFYNFLDIFLRHFQQKIDTKYQQSVMNSKFQTLLI